jgi:hypothetical protein
MSTASRIALRSAVVSTLLAGLAAQGKFVNYEDPQVKPIAVATYGGVEYVLACNTPDNSVEVYRAEWNLQAPIARVPVGLSPVTVKWNATTSEFFTCNFLGDSVTRERLEPDTSTTPATVRPVLEQTEWVGDEPSDIVFDPAGSTGVVTLHASGSVKRIVLGTLAPVTGVLPLGTFAPGHITPTAAPLNFYGAPHVPPTTTTLPVWAVKQARRIEVVSRVDGPHFYVLNTMGGELSSRSPYDLGLFAIDGSGGFHAVSGIGSTNLGFAVNAAGNRMFVVSQIAKNDGRMGVAAVANEPTGFVQTWLKVIDLPASGGPPTVVAEQTTGTGTKPLFRSIDLNRNYAVTGPTPVSVANRVAQATDVIVLPDPVAPTTAPEYVVLAGFGSEKVVILKPDAADPSGYTRTFAAISPVSSYPAAGPRGLAFSATSSQPGSTYPGLVFVLNRLDNSLAVVNPWTAAVTRRALGYDPTPANIRAGRKLLYTATATSGNVQEAMVSCSSCHVDARTDGLRWRLGDGHTGHVIPPHLIDGFDASALGTDPPEFPADKPEMVTQTLQGLVNYHLEPDVMQFMATNAPYHWRGDKVSVDEFNEAFVNLQDMTAISGTGPSAKGVSDTDMSTFVSFVNTIHHPPNPEQRLTRDHSGTQGNATDIVTGSGGLLGRKVYHIGMALLERSCVNCHSLPEGSSNTMTILGNVSTPFSSSGASPFTQHPFETAALRNVRSREMLVPIGYQATATTGTVLWPINGTSGLLHGGANSLGLTALASLTLNDNATHNFAFNTTQKEALTEFVRQLDTGTAPLVGFAWTQLSGSSPNDPAFDLALGQVHEANVGVAAYQRVSGVARGFWYDATTGLFQEESGSAVWSRDDLVSQLVGSDDVLIVQVTPAGSERRVAALDGVGAVLDPLAVPNQIEVLPMVPDTAFVGVHVFTDRIDPTTIVFPTPVPQSMLVQHALADAVVNSGSFGVPAIRHEPPRRFRVAGADILNGAKLGLESRWVPGVIVWFDLTPTDRVTETSDLPIWETVEELDATQTLALLCGGYAANGVMDVLLGNLTPTLPLDPASQNVYDVHVRNESGQTGSSGWVSLEVADQR